MSATNSTTNYSLPLFIGTDKPAWLTDWNGAMNSIDTAIAEVSTSQSGTASSLSTLSTTVETLGTTVSSHTSSIQTLSTSVSTNTGSINTINSLIGNGTPTTTDQTIIGAINEINAQVGQTVEADDVTYDNTTSGLTATDVQSAIDEVVANQGDLTSLTTTDKSSLVSAINELAEGGTNGITRTLLWSNSDTTSSFAGQTVTLSSDDYDELEIFYRYSTSTNHVACSKTLKGYNAFCTFATCLSGGASVLRRIATHVSDTSYTFTDGEQATGTTASSTDNTLIIPVAIYGIKYSD